MDSTRFDGLTRSLGSTLDRRTAVRGLAAGALAAALGGTALSADAKRRRRRKKKKAQTQEQPGSGNGTGGGNQDGTGGGGQNGGGTGGGGGSQTLNPGDFCQYHQQCPHQYICEVPVNAGNSDKTCCGAHNAPCGKPNEDGDDTAPYCCIGYYCAYSPGFAHGFCLPVPDEI